MSAHKPVDLSRGDDDEAPAASHDAKTIPPPSGAADAYSAATVVKAVIPELLAQAREQAAADGALSGASSMALRAASSAAPSAPPRPARQPGMVVDLSSSADDVVEAQSHTLVMPETDERRRTTSTAPKGALPAVPTAPRAFSVPDRPRAAAPATSPPAGSSTTISAIVLLALVLAAVIAALALSR